MFLFLEKKCAYSTRLTRPPTHVTFRFSQFPLLLASSRTAGDPKREGEKRCRFPSFSTIPWGPWRQSPRLIAPLLSQTPGSPFEKPMSEWGFWVRSIPFNASAALFWRNPKFRFRIAKAAQKPNQCAREVGNSVMRCSSANACGFLHVPPRHSKA